MKDRKVRVAIRRDMTNKANEQQRRLSGTGWKNSEITVDQLIDHIGEGFPFTHQFTDGHRRKENFSGTDILIADVDKGMSVEEALEHPFIKESASFLYTTPNHSEANHRFRIVFQLDRRIVDAGGYEALYETLMSIIPTDPSTKSCAQFFFGNSNAKFYRIDKSLSDRQITELINKGMEKRRKISNPPVAARLAPDTFVKVKSKGLQPISALAENTSIHCPFETHLDKNPSAFIKVNKDGVRGVQCRSCGHSDWTEKPRFQDDGFGYFDRIVTEQSGQANSHFEYHGLTKFDHDLETSMAKSNFSVTKSKLLAIDEVLPGINLIKSPKGTGKTHVLGELVSKFKNPEYLDAIKKKHQMDLKDERIILIGHRQSLIQESAAKLGLECYLDTGDYDTKINHSVGQSSSRKQTTQKPQHYAICLDSLSSRIRLNNENYGVVIIDESEQVFSHFFSEHMKNPTNNFDALSKLIKRAKYVFCLDADLDTITLSGVISCLSYSKDSPDRQFSLDEPSHHKKLYCHLNTYMPPSRELELFVSRNHLLDDLRKNLSSGKRCYITGNSKKFIQGQYEAFSKVYASQKFKLIVSDSGDDEDRARFLKDIKIEILDYDAVWSSPSIGTGIDITFPNEEEKIDVVYGFFDGGINTHFDIDQQLGRVRHPGAVKVWVSPKRERKSIDRNIILRELLDGEEVNGLRWYLDHNGAHASGGEHPFLELLTEVLEARRRSMNRLRDNFILHKQKSGWVVTDVEGDVIAKGKGSIIGKAGRAQRRKATTARLLAAADITFKDWHKIKELKDKNAPLTDEQKAELEKYYLNKFYDQNVTEDLILLDDDGKTREKIGLLETVINPTIELRNYSEIKSGLASSANYKGKNINIKHIQKVVFLRELFSAAGIYDINTLTFIPGATYGTNSLGDFINFMRNHKERLAQLFDKEINEHIQERPAVQIRTLLRLVGLNQVLVKANKGGNKGGATYKIDHESYQIVHDIIERRAAARAASQVEKHEDEQYLFEDEQGPSPDVNA